MIREFRARVGGPVRVAVGKPLPRAELAARSGDARAMMDYLRAETYRLSPDPLPDPGYGFDFEEGRDAHHANRRL